MITVIGLNLISYVGQKEFIQDTYKELRKMHEPTFAFSS